MITYMRRCPYKDILHEHRKKMGSERKSLTYMCSVMQPATFKRFSCFSFPAAKFRLFLKAKKLHGKTLDKMVN